MVSVKESELPPRLRVVVNGVIAESLRSCVGADSDAAASIKLGLDGAVMGPGWNCVVGSAFGSYFDHRPGTFHHATAPAPASATATATATATGRPANDVHVVVWRPP